MEFVMTLEKNKELGAIKLQWVTFALREETVKGFTLQRYS